MEGEFFWADTPYAPGQLILMRVDHCGIAFPFRKLETYCFSYKNFKRLQFTSFEAIPGEENHEGCFVYDPENFEFEEVTAPVKNYASVTEGYVNTTPLVMHTGKVLTEESYFAALAVANDLNEKLRGLARQDKQKEFDETFQVLCTNGICIYREVFMNDLKVEVNPANYTVVNLDDSEYYFRGIIIKNSSLPVRSTSVEIPVYRNSVSFAIGKKGVNAKKMAEALGVRRVAVISRKY